MSPFRIIACEQRSPEWFAARLGKLTGSVADKMLATIQKGEAAARRDLRVKLAVERLTGRSQEDTYLNAEMQRGIEMEPVARLAYEALTGDFVQTCGFCEHETLLAGCSLDGYVGAFDRLVSIKCPKSATHLRYLRSSGVPADYVPQMLHELWITGAQVYDFLSFDDRFPAALQVFHVRVLRDDAAVDAYAEKALAFLEEVDREVEALDTMANLRGTLEAAVTA